MPRPALADPDLKIPAGAVGRLLELAAERAHIDDFGLRLAETRKLSNMGAVALVAREQPTLRRALEVMGQYQWMQSEALSLVIDEADDVAVISLHLARRRPETARQATELSVGVLCRNIRALMGENWTPQEVFFHHAPPAKYDVHRRVFGVTPRFHQDVDGLVVTRAELDRPLPAADPVMAQLAGRYVEQLAHRHGRSARETAGELIVLLLPTDTCTADRVARHLGVNRRTLYRRLKAEETGFAALLDEKREELVNSLITDDRRSLAAIADLAGFASASSFSHWFKARFGVSPREFRRPSNGA